MSVTTSITTNALVSMGNRVGANRVPLDDITRVALMRVREYHLMIERQLQEAEELVASGLLHIAEQNRIIAELRESGHDTIAAERLQNTLLEAQALHKEYSEWLRHEFAHIPAIRVRRTAQPHTTLFIALAVGWLLGRSHCPL